MMFKKGDIVKVKAFITSRYVAGRKQLERHEVPDLKISEIYGIVLGYSFLRTGVIKEGGGWEGWEPPWLAYPLDHKVWVVEPLQRNNPNRYLIPYRCYEEDLEIIKD